MYMCEFFCVGVCVCLPEAGPAGRTGPASCLWEKHHWPAAAKLQRRRREEEEDELSPRRREATAAGGGFIVFCGPRETTAAVRGNPLRVGQKKEDRKKEYVMRRKTKSLNGAVLSLGCSTRVFRTSWFLTKTTFISQTHFIPAPSFLSHFSSTSALQMSTTQVRFNIVESLESQISAGRDGTELKQINKG